MKVAYFVDNSDAVNWGGQVTSAGMRYLVETTYPQAQFCPLKFGSLPFRNATFLRSLLDAAVFWAIARRHHKLLIWLLDWYGVNPALYKQHDVVCFNGEGIIHEKSGHFFRSLGSLYAFKASGARVYALNQTIDLNPAGKRASLLKLVYSQLDRVAVREPASLRQINALGITSDLVGDAAYALPRLTREQLAQRAARFRLPQNFIAVTASSSLKRDRRSVAIMDRLVTLLLTLGHPLVFLANTKTDLYLARQLAARDDIRIIGYEDAGYQDAIAIISQAVLLVGGRQHPNIFAAEYGVPFVGLAGNTHKMSGVSELLNYPIPVFSWSYDEAELREVLERVLAGHVDLSSVTVPVIERIDLG